MPKPHEYWMRLALEEARQAAEEDEIPVGAVIVHKDACIARAHNLCEQTGNPTAHAEMLAIQQACRQLGTQRLRGCTLYVTLEPCPMCAGALMAAQLESCYYAAADARQGCCASVYALPQDPAFYHHVYCIAGCLQEEAAALLRRFFFEKRQAKEAKGDRQ